MVESRHMTFEGAKGIGNVLSGISWCYVKYFSLAFVLWRWYCLVYFVLCQLMVARKTARHSVHEYLHLPQTF